MDLYCTKHKKLLAERLDSATKQIEPYCVYCQIDTKYQGQMDTKKDGQQSVSKPRGMKYWGFILVSFIIIALLPLHLFLKVLVILLFIAIVLKNIFSPYFSELVNDDNDRFDHIRAQALNQSSIQANEVDNMKRQWKKTFLQAKKEKRWTEEDWQKYLEQFYKK